MAMRIAGEVAAVTGASSGIGEELALQLGLMGLRVGLIARRRDRLEALAATIRERGGIAMVAPADLTEPDEIRAAMARVVADLGEVDLLIANAGLGLKTPAQSFSATLVDQMARVNLSGAAYAIEGVLPAMIRRRRGHLVGISSLSAFRGMPGASGYAASKAGLSTLLESLRPELRGLGISVTTVHPGFVRTAMTANQTNSQPFIMDADRAARIILRGIRARRRRIDFPWTLASALRFVQILPNALFDPFARKIFLERGSAQIDSNREIQ